MICTHKDLTYTLIRSNRKTMSIYVEPDGGVVVRAPEDAEIDKINNIIDLKSYWIYKSLAELQELNQTRVTRELVHGEGFLYMGRSYRLKIDRDLKKPLSLSQGYFLLDEKHVDRARELFINFYKEKAKKQIPARVEFYTKKIGVNPGIIRILNLKNRWASRGKNGLNVHWKVMLAPLSVIDYIVVHELAHHIKQNHSPAFWEIVESVMPNYEEKKNWLKLNGANLDI